MDTKEYLLQAFEIDRLVKAARIKIEELEEKRLFVSSLNYTEKVQTSINREKFNHLSDLYIDLINKFLDDEKRLLELQTEIKNIIDKLENPDHRLIMTERYINLKRWEDIGIDNNYSWDTIHRHHRNALKKVRIESYTIDMV